MVKTVSKSQRIRQLKQLLKVSPGDFVRKGGSREDWEKQYGQHQQKWMSELRELEQNYSPCGGANSDKICGNSASSAYFCLRDHKKVEDVEYTASGSTKSEYLTIAGEKIKISDHSNSTYFRDDAGYSTFIKKGKGSNKKLKDYLNSIKGSW